MNKISRIASASVVALTLGLALPAAALSLGDVTAKIQSAFSGNGSAQVGAGSTGTDGSASAGVGTSVETDGQICTTDAKMCPDGSYVGRTGPNCSFAPCSGTSDAGSSTSGTGTVSGSAQGGATVSADDDAVVDVVLMTRGDLDSSVRTNVSSAADVSSRSDLEAYIASEMNADANVEAVQVSGDSVSVTYREPARFLGFIPLSLKATATVDATGDVTIDYPWYSFLYAKANADLETQLESRVRSLIGADLSGAAGGTIEAGSQLAGSADANGSAGLAADVGADMLVDGGFTADTQARLVAEMRAAMETAFDASASASANANAEGSVQTR